MTGAVSRMDLHAIHAAAELAVRARRAVRDVVARANGRCELWPAYVPASTEPRRRSPHGHAMPANLLLLCDRCARWVDRNPVDARLAGLTVQHPDDPEQMPVWLRGSWWLLTVAGAPTRLPRADTPLLPRWVGHHPPRGGA